jgi:hypothetical protein
MPDKAFETIFEVLPAALMKIQVFLSCWLCRLVNTEFPNYDAANVLVKASRPTVVQSVRRAYAASYNENPVVTGVSKDCLALKIVALCFTETSMTYQKR